MNKALASHLPMKLKRAVSHLVVQEGRIIPMYALKRLSETVTVGASAVVYLGYEGTTILNRHDRPSEGLYQRSDSTANTGRTTAQPGHAPGHHCYPVRPGQRHPVADAANGLSKMAKCVSLCSSVTR